MSRSLRLVLAVSGASGSAFARRLLQRLVSTSRVAEVHLVVSDTARRIAAAELGTKAGNVAQLADLWLDGVERVADVRAHPFRDVGAPPASGSFHHDGMVVVPCSTATAAAIAHGTTTNLVHRAAECTLKERRRLVLMLRESPLSLVHLENLLALARAGATVMPISPPWYHGPRTLDDLVDHGLDRMLDHLGLPELVHRRWQGEDGSS